jgi:hypothetical protein
LVPFAACTVTRLAVMVLMTPLFAWVLLGFRIRTLSPIAKGVADAVSVFSRDSRGRSRCCAAGVVSAQRSEACYQRVLLELQALELFDDVLDVFVSHG